MKHKLKIILLLCLLWSKNIDCQTFTGIGGNFGDFSGFEDLVILGSVIGAGLLILGGNDIHASYNYCHPALIWDKTKDKNVKSGQGFNIEIRKVIEEKHRVLIGFQRNFYSKQISAIKNVDVEYDYYHAGYTQDILKLKKHKWQLYLGGDFIYSDKELALGILIGSRLSLSSIFQIENRVTMSKNNLNVQLGVSIRYRKGKWRDSKLFKS